MDRELRCSSYEDSQELNVMGMNNEKKIKRAEDHEKWKRQLANAERATSIVKAWNWSLANNVPPMFYPTIEAAILAKHNWLIIHCLSCDLIIDLDLMMKPRPPEATVLMAFRDIRCPRCNGHGRPKILKLAKEPAPSSAPGWFERNGRSDGQS